MAGHASTGSRFELASDGAAVLGRPKSLSGSCLVRKSVAERPDQTARLKLHRDPESGEVSIGDAAAGVFENLRVGAAGTIGAINTDTLGVAANCALRPGRGGARNSASRKSHALKRAQVENLLAAVRFAGEIDLPFNRMINIHWEAAGVPLSEMVRATGRFIDLLSKTIVRHGGKTAWVWTHEGGEKKGGHVHILAHVPNDVIDVVTGLQRRWLKAITGNPYRSGVIRTKPIGPRRGVETSNPALHQENLKKVSLYIVKGLAPDLAQEVGISRPEPGGMVIGKRCGTSQNIGRKARAKARGTRLP